MKKFTTLEDLENQLRSVCGAVLSEETRSALKARFEQGLTFVVESFDDVEKSEVM